MLTIDEIRIEGEEDGFHLVIYAEEPRTTASLTIRYRIGLPDQFLHETQRTIGDWLAEGERAARQHQIDQGTAPDSRREPDYDLARDMERGK